MIPDFPQFKKLELDDKKHIEKMTHGLHPYSDFNFVSMWSWDIIGDMAVSQLNGNLVLKFTDYMNREPFYSFIGGNKVNETVETLIKHSEKEGLEPRLKLVPEICAANLDNDKFLILEDGDNFDYIYDIEKLKSYDGNKLRSKRNLSNRFKKQYASRTEIINPHILESGKQIIELFKTWADKKNLTEVEDTNEFIAFERALKALEKHNLIVLGVYIDDKLVGFTLNEILKNEYAILHFIKGNHDYEGIYAFLMEENSKILHSLGKKFLNFEQDLGIPGLRLSKKAFRPSGYLKKYIVKRK